MGAEEGLLKYDPSCLEKYRAPRAGEIIKNKSLADVFKLLAERGQRGFYEGPVAEAIVEISQKYGGYMTLDDLKSHRSEEVDPVSITLNLPSAERSIDLWEHPPNGQGIIAQMALGILAELESDEKIPRFTVADHNTSQ
jgi:gamma-glutamyltranspeptidase / glutathione hydrolase